MATVNMAKNTNEREKKKKDGQTRPTFSVDRLCHPDVFHRESHQHMSIRKCQRINREDLDKLNKANSIYFLSDCLLFSVRGVLWIRFF